MKRRIKKGDSMEASYKHSYKTGENLLNSLSVYNVGYQKCDPEYQWGPGVRDHYCIHHILSGSGCYCTGTVSKHLEEGDTFILYPGVELRYQADAPWEYAWAGFMGADAASLIRNTEFSRETPYILKGRIPTEKIRDGLERIYNAKGNTYEAAVAMTGEMYSLLAVFMHYAEHEEKEKAIQLTYAEKAESYIETNYSYPITVEEIASYVGISRSHLFRSFQNYMNRSPKEYTGSSRRVDFCERQIFRSRRLLIRSVLKIIFIFQKLFVSRKGKVRQSTERAV